MATDHNNLGYKVTTRTISWEQLVHDAWGSEWNERDEVYDFGWGHTREDTDNTDNGIYNK